VTIRLKEGQHITPNLLLARIKREGAETVDVRSPLPGQVSVIKVEKEAQVNSGEELVVLAPDKNLVWEALRALALIGQPEDLPEVERYVRGVEDMPDEVKRQAMATAEAIRKRQ
jgi:hypothetical protein